MKLKKGLVLREIDGEFMAVPFDESFDAVSALVSLNETGAFLWKLLEKDVSEEELALALEHEYGISREDANAAVKGFISGLLGAGLLA